MPDDSMGPVFKKFGDLTDDQQLAVERMYPSWGPDKLRRFEYRVTKQFDDPVLGAEVSFEVVEAAIAAVKTVTDATDRPARVANKFSGFLHWFDLIRATPHKP